MPGPTGFPNLLAMRGRRKGGASASQIIAPQGMAAHVAAFLGQLSARAYSNSSLEAHHWALRQFTAWAAGRGMDHPACFTRASLEAYQLFLYQYRSPRGARPLAVNTQIARLGCVRRLFAWLCRSGAIPANPAADLDLPRKQARPLPRTLSATQIQKLLAIPNPADPFGLRDRAMLELLYATGIRRTEMANLDHGDYDAATRSLHVRKGKNGKSRLLPVGERAALWLDRFLAESRPLFDHLPGQTALFLSGYGTRITPAYLGNWIKKLLIRCGIDQPGSCHLFRHSCATDMHRGGADIRYVQELLGHERMETTQIYTHVHIDALREVHSRCHPHGRLGQAAQPAERIAPSEQHPVDFASPAIPDPLTVSPMTVAQATNVPHAARAEVPCWSPPSEDPPDESPPAGKAPKTPKPPFMPQGGLDSRKTLEKTSLRQAEDQTQTPGVAYYGYRWYDPVAGRWPSRDPIEEAGGVNLYGFVENVSVGKVDLLGLEDFQHLQDAVMAGAKKIYDLTRNSRIAGLSEWGRFFKNTDDWRFHQKHRHMVNGSATNFRVYGNLELHEAGYVGLIFGREHGVQVFCCENNKFRLSKVSNGIFPGEQLWKEGTYGITPNSYISPCEKGKLVADLHSHNIGRGIVKKGGLEEYRLGPIFPSETDISGKINGVEYFVVSELNLGAMVLLPY